MAAEAGMTLQQPEARSAFSRGSCPRITGPWQWWAAQPPERGAVWRVTCAHTQAFWRWQQQPQRLMPVSGVCADRRGSRPSLEFI